jgi:hypothetical protein
MNWVLTMEPFDPNPEPDQALLHWAEAVELLLRLPSPLRARAISHFADRIRCYVDLLQGSAAIHPWQMRTINRLLGFEVIPVPQRHWRFGPNYGALRKLFGRFLIWRVGVGWWVFAVLALAPMYLLGLVLSAVVSGPRVDFLLKKEQVVVGAWPTLTVPRTGPTN